ncbi:hypothetical protein RVIR1_06330 [Candidatus Rickettsiella viridis]|uniref:Uncharacterized protein n=1 Tax=Candidatus Rickettsiella viridis TaxID=676208 RepID=A0A2Z5V3W0_9COXI|nr:hypothetical protein [Candidatus Rickettsiella viridis]BBB15132.1 hypothetical protein RVIR1_06330 [Candidatus Rickettsiella viridis]
MTANVSLNQLVHLKQPACDYLFQIKCLIRQLQELRDEATNLLFHAQVKSKSSDKLSKNGDIALIDIKDLYKLYSKGLIRIEAIVIELIRRKRKLNQLYKDYFSLLLEERD